MAINRERREDLMRDATAYARRLTLKNPKNDEQIFVGMRQQGGWSVYFGEDPVYQFNNHGKLRRAHFKGLNYAANDGKLQLLHRDRSGGHVEIQRIYSADAERCIIDDCRSRLGELAELLENCADKCECFPADDREIVADLVGLVWDCSRIEIADTGNVW